MTKFEDVSHKLGWGKKLPVPNAAKASKTKMLKEATNPLDKPMPKQAEMMEKGKAKLAEKMGMRAVGKRVKHSVEKFGL